MTTYADPTRCPDCHAVLPHDPQACRVCSLPLTGDAVGALFATLQEADRLLGVLRTQKQTATAAVRPQQATTSGSRLAGVDRYPAGSRRPAGSEREPRLRGASVPKILLSLGALCLLVAAVIFLAVAWSWLDVGGRTVVLVGVTGTALVLAGAMNARELRMAAEALSVVGLGLLVVDMVGARHAGWLGPMVDDLHLGLLTGAAVTTVALLILVSTARRPLVAPALIAPAAVLVGAMGAQVDALSLGLMVATVVVLLGLLGVGTVLPSRPLQDASLVAVALAWAGLVMGALDRFGDPVTVASYVGHDCWAFLAATGLAAAVGPVSGGRRGIAVTGYAVAALAGTYTVLVPVLDNAPTAALLSVLGASVGWLVVLAVAPRMPRPVPLVAIGGTLVVPVVASAQLADGAARALLTVGSPFAEPWSVHVRALPTSASPLLLLATAVTVALTTCSVVRLTRPVSRATWTVAVGTAAMVGGTATLARYDVPLALVVGMGVAAGIAGIAAAERLAGSAADLNRLGALVLTTGSALVALPSDRITTGVLAVACAMAGYLMRRSDATGAVAAVCLPIAFGGLVWAGGNVTGLDQQLRALPVLAVLGALAVWRPRPELELSTVLVGTLVSTASILAAPDLDAALAVHLTIAGVLVTTSSIVNPSRRVLAWPGGALLALDSWVRLADLGVHLPEAYTLPSALVLVAVGGWRLRRDGRSATLTCLAPGLALATVPSLIATLDAPYSLRALVLGAACLGLILAGAALRWSAPVVVGAAVATLLVLRELAPYAAATPTWLTIGTSGAALLVVGVTWESRMSEVQRASKYVAALR